jgi:transcriptional regulator with XRE-family HTH domain
MRQIQNKAFKNWLRREVCSTGLSMRQVAAYIGVHPQQLSKWIKGENLPNLCSFKRLCVIIAQLTKQDVNELMLVGLSQVDITKFER